MAFTDADITALETAIKSGHKRVKYADKEAEHQSLKDMIDLLNLMKANVATNRKRVKYLGINKGQYGGDR